MNGATSFEKSEIIHRGQSNENDELNNTGELINKIGQTPTVDIILTNRLEFGITMEIESGHFEDSEFSSVKFDLCLQNDWKLENGFPSGTTHCSNPGSFKNNISAFNFIETFSVSTTNFLNCPQIIFSIYSLDFFSRVIVKGYGQIFLPLKEGKITKRVKLFRPVSSNFISGFFGKLFGKNPEYVDPVNSLIHCFGRKFTSTEPAGWLDIKFETTNSGWKENGFS